MKILEQLLNNIRDYWIKRSAESTVTPPKAKPKTKK